MGKNCITFILAFSNVLNCSHAIFRNLNIKKEFVVCVFIVERRLFFCLYLMSEYYFELIFKNCSLVKYLKQLNQNYHWFRKVKVETLVHCYLKKKQYLCIFVLFFFKEMVEIIYTKNESPEKLQNTWQI